VRVRDACCVALVTQADAATRARRRLALAILEGVPRDELRRALEIARWRTCARDEASSTREARPRRGTAKHLGCGPSRLGPSRSTERTGGMIVAAFIGASHSLRARGVGRSSRKTSERLRLRVVYARRQGYRLKRVTPVIRQRFGRSSPVK
jgi:hypothetical protein